MMEDSMNKEVQITIVDTKQVKKQIILDKF